MKKKFLALILGVSIAFGCTGCSDNIYTGTKVEKLGRLIVLEEEGSYRDNYGLNHVQYLAYDKDTYIIYIYDSCSSGSYKGGVSISPFYCMNANNEPEIAVYWEGMDK